MSLKNVEPHNNKSKKTMNSDVKVILIVIGIVIVVLLIGLAVWAGIANQQRRITNQYIKNIQTPLQPNLDSNSETIFVSIPSYRDPELVSTILDCFSKATQPSRVFVGVCYQYNDIESRHVAYGNSMTSTISIVDDDFWTVFHKRSKTIVSNGLPQSIVDDCQSRITVVTLSASSSTGPALARQLIQSKLLQAQKYVLMIDSGSSFAFGWDSMLINDLKYCHESLSDRNAILTMRPSNFDLDERTSNSLPALLEKLYKKHPNLFRLNEFKTFQMSVDARHALWSQFVRRVDPHRPSHALQFSNFIQDEMQRGLPELKRGASPDYDVTESELRVKPFTERFQSDNETSLIGNHNLIVSNYLQNKDLTSIYGNDMKRYSKNRPMRGLFWTPQCSFTLATVHKRIDYMSLPYILSGEEITMSAIYWTHGYNFYTPSVQPLRHKPNDLIRCAINVQEDNRNVQNNRNVQKNEINEIQNLKAKTQRQSYCLLRRFLLIEPRTQHDNQILAQNGLKIGQERTLSEFLNHVGLDLVKQTSTSKAHLGMPVQNVSDYTMIEKLQRLGYVPTATISDNETQNNQETNDFESLM